MPPTRTVAQNPIRDEPVTTASSNPITINNDISNSIPIDDIQTSPTFSNTKSQPVNIKKSSNLTKQIKNNSAFNTDNRSNFDRYNNDYNISPNMVMTTSNNDEDDMYESMIAANFEKMNLMFVPEEEEVNLRAFIFFEACSKLITELALSS